MDYARPAPLGPSATLAADMPLRKPNDVRRIEPGARTGNTATDTGRDRDNGPTAAAARDITRLRRELGTDDLPAGPTPAFEVSQLELDADLQHVIARLEAARSQAREADAVRAETQDTAERPAAARDRTGRLGAATPAQDRAPAATGAATGAGMDAATPDGPGRLAGLDGLDGLGELDGPVKGPADAVSDTPPSLDALA